MASGAERDVFVLITNAAAFLIKLESPRVKQDTEGSRHRAEQGGKVKPSTEGQQGQVGPEGLEERGKTRYGEARSGGKKT